MSNAALTDLITPTALKRSQLVQAHVRRTLDVANKGEIPIPAATKAKVIVQQTLEFLNKRLSGVKTVDGRVKQQIASAIEVIRDTFEKEGVPKPQSIIDNWLGGRVQLKINFSKDVDRQMAIDQLLALEPIDEETKVAIDEVIQNFKKVWVKR